jgi:hypothetical protein
VMNILLHGAEHSLIVNDSYCYSCLITDPFILNVNMSAKAFGEPYMVVNGIEKKDLKK